MSCPTRARLAAAVSGEDLDVIEHTRECLTCRAVLIEHRELIAAARQLPRPRLRPEHRAQLAAEVMAASDFEPARWCGERVMAIVASIVAAAAVVTLVVAARPPAGQVPAAPDVATLDEPSTKSARRGYLDPVAAPQRAAIIGKGAVFARAHRGDQDVITLRDGEVSIDATDREPVTVVAGDTRVMIASSRATVIARQGVIVTTHVFAGTAQVTTNGDSQVIDAGDVWMREEPTHVTTATNDVLTSSLAAFRQGWEELRAKRPALAVAAFDRATDPVVAEDAAFWAAIATERTGDLDGAATRLRAFLDNFPLSPRAQAARAALVRVTQ